MKASKANVAARGGLVGPDGRKGWATPPGSSSADNCSSSSGWASAFIADTGFRDGEVTNWVGVLLPKGFTCYV